MTEQPRMVIIRTVTAWTEQANTALDAITAANGGHPPARIADAATIAPAAFESLIEALNALGENGLIPPVGEDLIRLARLRPVDEVL